MSGPNDLQELRRVVETALGVGTWPTAGVGPGEIRAVTVALDRPSAALGLLIAMEGVIDDRSPWRTWRTAIENLAPAVASIGRLTIEARLIEPTD